MENNILVISTVIAVAMLVTWVQTYVNVKKIKNSLDENKTKEYLVNKYEIALFSMENDKALSYLYKILFYEYKALNDYNIGDGQENRKKVLKDEYFNKIKSLGGKWPNELT